MSSQMIRRPSCMAVPQLPAAGPISRPHSAVEYAAGRPGAMLSPIRRPSSPSRAIEATQSPSAVSIIATRRARTSRAGSPRAVAPSRPALAASQSSRRGSPVGGSATPSTRMRPAPKRAGPSTARQRCGVPVPSGPARVRLIAAGGAPPPVSPPNRVANNPARRSCPGSAVPGHAGARASRLATALHHRISAPAISTSQTGMLNCSSPVRPRASMSMTARPLRFVQNRSLSRSPARTDRNGRARAPPRRRVHRKGPAAPARAGRGAHSGRLTSIRIEAYQAARSAMSASDRPPATTVIISWRRLPERKARSCVCR